MENEIEVVIQEESGRIDKVLNERLKDYSRSQIQQWIKDGQVSVDEQPIKTNYKVSKGDQILIRIP